MYESSEDIMVCDDCSMAAWAGEVALKEKADRERNRIPFISCAVRKAAFSLNLWEFLLISPPAFPAKCMNSEAEGCEPETVDKFPSHTLEWQWETTPSHFMEPNSELNFIENLTLNISHLLKWGMIASILIDNCIQALLVDHLMKKKH